jgi:RNA polymerase sigma-70 factor (ECF subfamily)
MSFGDRDSDTVQRVLQRDPVGLEQLLRDHGGKVRGALVPAFGSLGQDLDDVMSIAAFRAWEGIAGFDSERGTLRGWFFRIARNAAIEHLRRCRRWKPEPPGGDGPTRETVSDTEAEGDDRDLGLRARRIDALFQAIAGLPRLQREVVLADLADSNGTTTEELAARLGSTPNSILASRSKARRSLRLALQRLGLEP